MAAPGASMAARPHRATPPRRRRRTRARWTWALRPPAPSRTPGPRPVGPAATSQSAGITDPTAASPWAARASARIARAASRAGRPARRPSRRARRGAAATAGVWTEGSCCPTSCGEPCLADCAAPACECGPESLWDDALGCRYERACERGPRCDETRGDLDCAPGEVCCASGGCQAPMCGRSRDARGCPPR